LISLDAMRFNIDKLISYPASQPCCDLILHLQQIAAVGIEFVDPKMSAVVGVDELSIDPHLCAGWLNRAFQHVAHA
jgi:hypothetical protein